MVSLDVLLVDDVLDVGRVKINNNFSSLSDAVEVLEGTPSLSFGGVWDASLNSPDLVSGSFGSGVVFRVSVGGSTVLDGVSDWSVGDLVVRTDLGWLKIDQSERVESVNGEFGVVELTSDDVDEGLVNEYYSVGKVEGVIDDYVDSAFVNSLVVDANTLNGSFSSDFASAVQGGLAESAVQPGDDAVVLGSGVGVGENEVLASDGVGGTGWVVLSTDDVVEGGNEYYSDSKVEGVVTEGFVSGLGVDAASLGGEGLGSFVLQSEVGAVDGVAGLDVNGLVPLEQLPTGVATSVSSVATVVERDGLVVESGDVAVVAETGLTYVFDGSSWVEVTAASDVTSVNGGVGDVVLDSGDLGDVNVGTLSTGEVLRWDGTEWVNSLLSYGVSDLTDVDVSGVSDGSVLVWNDLESRWKTSEGNLNFLSDVDVSGLSDEDVLYWNNANSSWENTNLTGLGVATTEDFESLNVGFTNFVSSVVVPPESGDVGDVVLGVGGLADVEADSPTAGQVLAWDGVDSWDATTLSLGDSSDVSIGSLSGGEILQYDSGAGEWTPVSPAYLVASDVDTIAELNNIVADANLLSSEDIDTLAELNSVITDATLVDASHTHEISEITDFDTHTHTITDITDFDTHTHTTADFDDFNVTSVATNEFLQWDGTDWVNTTISSSDIQNFSTDVQNVIDETYVSSLDVTANVLEETSQQISAGATQTLDLSTGNVFQVTLTQDATLDFSGVTLGKVNRMTVELIQDSSGNHNVTLPSSVTWENNSPPTFSLNAGATDIIEMYTADDGVTWRAHVIGLNFPPPPPPGV